MIFFMVKALYILSLFVFLNACSNKDNKETKDLPAQKPPASDSPAVKKIENRDNPYVLVDVSPMDMSYFPTEYLKLKMARKISAPPLARVIYSRPHLQGRHVFHDVLKYGEPWRLGANESTELQLFKDATIGGKKIRAGRYVLYCIPQENKWTIVLNTNVDSWGLQPDLSKDVARFESPVVKTNNSLEYFTMLFQNAPAGASLLMAWDNVEIRLPFVF
jgi:Protein of unknown function (DUF2911)